jgi:predicted Rossmann fold nucleotide-binding protein DprA/Smf involved in DNA uptake
MIREGWATLVTSSTEVIQALGGAPGLLAACRRGPPPTSLRPELADAVARIQAAESDAGAVLDPDRLCSLTGLKAGLVLAALSFREAWSVGVRQG